ncbi:unnamed protein product [Lactuca saligna]|uniref:Uncharacterized protein n=1 Tax=Lactuca saligna TaxID=75948 RepID=A0AA35UZ45_LACSI|nr:unnamed protein product [Lactuca saligna]
MSLSIKTGFPQVSSKGRTVQCQNYLGEVVEVVVEEVEEVVEVVVEEGVEVVMVNMYQKVLGKKEPGIETQFFTQTTPNVESQFITQTAPTVDSEHVSETQKADVNIDDEVDGIDMADLDQILSDLSYLRESKYSEAEILICLNITQSQLKGFDALIHQSKQAAKMYQKQQEDNGEDGAEESQEDNDEDGAEESQEEGW